MTNQVNQEFEKWFKNNIQGLAYPNNEPAILAKHNAKCGWQAATKASESEINLIKQRVEALQADNLRLREALTQLTALKFSTASHIQKLDAVAKIANKALSSTPTQSLAEHDKETIERIIFMLENAEGELKTLSEYIALVRKMKHE